MPSKQNTSYNSAKQDGSGLCLNKEGKIECELPNQAQTQNYTSQEVIPPAHLKSNVCKQNKPSIYPSSQDVANSKPNGNTIFSNTAAFLPLVDSSITVQHANNKIFQRSPSLVKRSTIPHQPIDQQLNKGYFRKRHRTRPPQTRGQQRNRYNTPWFRYILQHNSPDWIKHLDLVRQVTVPVLKCPAPITNNQ